MTQEKRTATIDLPEGYDAKKLAEIVARYEKNQVSFAKLGKARREAVNALIAKHQPEYDALLTVAKKKHGVPATKS